MVAGAAPSSVSVPLSRVSAAGLSVAPSGRVTPAVKRAVPAPPIRPAAVSERTPAKVSSAPASAVNRPASVASAGAAASDSVPCAACTVPSLSSRVETVVRPDESFSRRPPAVTWTCPLPLLQTRFPPPEAIVNVASRRRTPPLTMQMSPPLHDDAAPIARVAPSIRSCAPVVFVSPPLGASVPEPEIVAERSEVAPDTVSVRALANWSVAPASTTSVEAVAFWSVTRTLSPEASVTSSAPFGACPHDQLAPVCQLPPAAPW